MVNAMNMKKGNRVLLASQSPRRRELLKLLFADFGICVTNADETLPAGAPPGAAVREIALRKARAAVREHSDALVIAADTVVSIDRMILGKPRGAADAAQMLRRLSGRTHQVYTGVALCRGGHEESFFVKTDVAFAPLDESEIAWYLATDEPFDKAGAYGIQGYGARFITGIAGDYFNVMGLPVNAIYERLGEICR